MDLWLCLARANTLRRCPVFQSEDEKRNYGKKLDGWRVQRFKPTQMLSSVHSQVAVLLRRAWGAGLRIVTASSAKKDELKKIYRRSGYRRPGGCGDVVRGRR
ncbi:hypothetical protein ACNJYA_09545 [Bradyrhizobium sp. DASA03068]|uniref:hypothetical protein n=1 Tax=Bradyrhizobium sp. BLXBL-01 TaxID=3395915 RepID=UPI003F718CF2